MKNLLLIFLLFLASCSVHKNIQSSHVKTDSSVVSHKDSSYISRDTAHYSDFEAKGVDIEIGYPNGDVQHIDSPSYHYEAPASDPFAALVKDAVANSGKPGNIAAYVKIHADSISEKTGSNVTMDSGHVSQAADVHVKTQTATASKVVTKTGGIPWWVWVVLGLGVAGYGAVKVFKLSLPVKI